ncbi:MAG: hypothetical protein U9N01_04435 [Euryarchaeota archaeon]|nr:hypothetical protein [Euryarchaeota archaeon]
MSEIEFTRLPIPEHIRERVFQDIGQASTCWENFELAGLFDTEQASEIATGLCQFIITEINKERHI